MSMPIQRQSESFGYFDEGPRYARDRSSTDLPRGLAGLINNSGPRIQAGLLNTRTASDDSCEYCGQPGHDWQVHPEAHRDVADWEREKAGMEFPFGDHTEGNYPEDDAHGGEYWPGHQASRLAVNVDGMDPDEHAYHTELPYGPGEGREWNPNFGYEPSDEDERRSEGVYDDDESGYNWGPDPSGHLHPDDIEHSPSAEPFDTPIYNPSPSPYDPHLGSRHPFDREAAVGGHDVPWEEDGEGGWHHPVGGFRVVPSDEEPGHYQLLSPHVGRGDDLAKIYFPHPDPQALIEHATYMMGGPRPTTKVGFAPAPVVVDPNAYQLGHRIGTDWRGSTIPGTVIGLEGQHVAVRWDDGQHSSEEPRNIHLL